MCIRDRHQPVPEVSTVNATALPADAPEGALPSEVRPEIVTWEKLCEAIKASGKAYNMEMITKAYDLANKAHNGVCRRSGEPYICHPLAVARLVLDLGMDSESIAAALLLPVLGTMNHKTILQYVMTLVIYILVRCVTDQFVRGVSRGTFAAAPKGKTFFLNAAAAAAVMLLVYLVVHPGVMGLLYLMPKWLELSLIHISEPPRPY